MDDRDLRAVLARVNVLERDLRDLRTQEMDGSTLPANLLAAVLAAHRFGGGQLMYGWLADSRQNYGEGATTLWTGLNIAPIDYYATANGGPYVDLDTAEALYILDAAWQEAGTEELFGFHWCNLAGLPGVGAVRAIASKYDSDGNNASWMSYVMNVAGTTTLRWLCNATGNPVNNIAVISSHSVAINTWYFVAWYWQTATLMRIWVATANENALTADSVTVSVPASLFNGTAPLAIGTAFNAAPTLLYPWYGFVGPGKARLNTQPANVNAYANYLFRQTRFFYQA